MANGKVLLQHPHHTDEAPIEVDNTSEALTPWMVKGYGQYKPAQTDPPADTPSTLDKE